MVPEPYTILFLKPGVEFRILHENMRLVYPVVKVSNRRQTQTDCPYLTSTHSSKKLNAAYVNSGIICRHIHVKASYIIRGITTAVLVLSSLSNKTIPFISLLSRQVWF